MPAAMLSRSAAYICALRSRVTSLPGFCLAKSPAAHLPRPAFRSPGPICQQRLLSTAPKRGMATSSSWLRSWMAAEPEAARYSSRWWTVWTIRFIVFAITGSSSMKFVRPVMEQGLGVEGSMMEGPWSYRIASIVCVTPIYTVILLLVGTLSGQHVFFKHVAQRMWSRFLPGIIKPPKKM